MRMRQQCAVLAASVLIFGGAACADRGDMSSDNRNDQPAAAPSGTADHENRTPVTVTGCFQDMSGPNNFVLSNIGDAQGVAPSETRAYRIEQSGDYEQYVGKKVRVSGWVDSDEANRAARSTTLQGTPGSATQGTSGTAQGMPAGRATSGDELDFNDLPELHIETISAVGEACGAAR